jgi:Uncharacterized conserved protein
MGRVPAGIGLGLALLVAATCSAARSGEVPSSPQPASVAALPTVHVQGTTLRIDPAQSHVGFQVRTLLGQRIEGLFERFQGEVAVLADGRYRVRLRLDAGSAQIPHHPRYSRWLRGPQFFDVARFPEIVFESEPYPAALLTGGGALAGWLNLRGTRHPEHILIEPAACGHPGYDCQVLGRGVISRGRYGMTGLDVMLKDRVVLQMRMRLGAGAPAP